MSDTSIPHTFTATLYAAVPGQSWTFLTVPFSVADVWGTRARLAVTVSVNGSALFRTSLSPAGDGTHTLMVNNAMRTAAGGVANGDTVTVTIAPDTAPRTIEAPDDLTSALAADADAATCWDKLAYSHRKEYVGWITGAKREETRARRVAKAVAMLRENKRLT